MNWKFRLTLLALNLIINSYGGVESLNYIKHAINIIAKKVEGIIEETVTNTRCGKDLKQMVHDVFKRKKWAVQMIDATAKIEPGILVGNVNQMGNYDECLAIREKNIKGQYCTVVIGPSNGTEAFTNIRDPFWITNFLSSRAKRFLKKNTILIKLYYGICIPSSCSVENLQSISSYIQRGLSLPIFFQFSDGLCSYEGKPLFSIGVELYIFMAFGFYFAIITAATIYEVCFFDGDENSLSSYICTFSLRRNATKLFSSEVGEDNIECINGIKVLSMIWIIIGHRFLVNALTPNVNTLFLVEWKENIRSMVVLGATVAVDTFLTISGLLLSYIYLRYTELKNVRVNMISFYMLRIFRLTPPLFAVILIYIAVLKYASDGPLWPLISAKLAISCVRYGWTNLLYVNNYVNLTDQCILQSWYLSVDTQLYFLFPLIFFSITKNPRQTFFWMACIGMISSVASMFISIYYDYNSTILDLRYANNLYQNTFLRMPVWLIGVAAGYAVFKYKDKEFVIRQRVKLLLWIVTLLVSNAIVFGQVFLIRNENNSVISAIFNAFGRPMWALTICWIIFACVTKNGGFVNTILSLPVFNVIGKLTYSLYLVHMMVILVIAGRRRHVDHFNNIRAIHEFCGDAVFSLLVGTCFSLLFESPLITFAKKVFRRIEADLDEKGNTFLTVIKYRFFIPVKVYAHAKVE